MKLLFLFLFPLVLTIGHAQHTEDKQDLRTDWLVHSPNGYTSFSPDLPTSVIHFPIKIRQGTGALLEIKSSTISSVFINNQLLLSGKTSYSLAVDSLRGVFKTSHFIVSVYISEGNFNKLRTYLVYPEVGTKLNSLEPAPATFFNDFIVIASILILLLLVFIVRLNSKLASDYFSVTKIFSLHESEDSIVYTRITSSGNFLFYGFSSLTIGFFLFILDFYLLQRHWFQVTSFQEAMLYWMIVSLVVVLIFVSKMVLILLFATLFNLREVAGMQFFNWVRLLFLSVGILLALAVLTIIVRKESISFFGFLDVSLGWIIGLWLILAFFKIAVKSKIGLFHLFSYLCATEIIPSLIVLKILFY